MSDRSRPGMGVTVTTSGSVEADPQKKEMDMSAAFRIAVMGNFSGNRSSATEKPGQIKFIEVDRDNFEDVMGRLNIRIGLQLSDSDEIQIEISELDDFHPDSLYEKLETFSHLRGLRRRLKNNRSYAEAAAEIQGWFPRQAEPEQRAEQPPEQAAAAEISPTEDNLLDSILDAQSPATAEATENAGIDRLIRQIVAPYVEPKADPGQEKMLAMVDQATERHMRDILRHPQFQAVESAWRGLWFLLKRIESDTKVKVYLLDIGKQALQNELDKEDVKTSNIYRLFCDVSAGDQPWGLIVGHYCFDDTIGDILTLANMGVIAAQAEAPFIAAGSEKLVGCESYAQTADYEDWNYPMADGAEKAWQMLRRSSVAPYIGLVSPAFLLRLPYGRKSSPIDSFPLEEIAEESDHGSFLWGNPALIKAECMARNFIQHGWKMQLAAVFQTDNLPVYYVKDEGETLSKPVTEILLTEKSAEILSTRGLMPLWAVRGGDSIRSTDYRSIAETAEVIR